MPAYPWLFSAKVDDASIAAHMTGLRRVGVPYSDAEIAAAAAERARQDRDRRPRRLPPGARHRRQVRSRAWTSTICASPSRWCRSLAFLGLLVWAGLSRHRAPLRRSRPAALRRRRRRGRGHERLLQRRLVDLHRRRHGRQPDRLPGAAGLRQPAPADGRRQQHRPRLRRGPGRDEQPAADVVGGAVRADGRLLVRLRLLLPGPRRGAGQPRLDQPRRARRRPGARRRGDGQGLRAVRGS